MKKHSVCIASAIMISGCMIVHAHTGHLVFALFDRETGQAISNATVTVTVDKCRSLSWHASPKYEHTSACTGTNGVADVEFSFNSNMFSWKVDAPAHYSRRCFSIGYEHFSATVVPSDYLNIDTNTVDGLAKYNELVSLHNSGDIIGYLSKFEPKSVTYTENTIYRSASLFPKHNPQPMYAYGDNIDAYLSMKHTVEVTNGIEVAKYTPADFDMKEGLLLSTDPNYKHIPGWNNPVGKVSDFHIERFCVTTNGVRNFYGWIDFAPGCGAYIRKTTGDDSFPTTYEADTNATFLSRIPFEYHSVSGECFRTIGALAEDEYMVLRTRVATNSVGVVTNCNYSKILGPMWIEGAVQFKHMVFNPRPNDPNLEFDMENNMAEDHGSNRYP